MGFFEEVGSWWASVNAPVGSTPTMTTDEYAQAAPFAGATPSDVGSAIESSASASGQFFEAAKDDILSQQNFGPGPTQPLTEQEYHESFPAESKIDSFGSSLGSWWGDVVKSTQGVSQPDEFAEPKVSDTSNKISASEVKGSDKISTGESHFGDTRDESGSYKILSTDTSTPLSQKFTDLTSPHAQEINRADYVKIENLGDSKTQELLKQGYSPEDALAMQRDAAKEAGNVRAMRYYQNEYDKSLENNIALSSAYHRDALASGLPQAPNKFEYVGDISKDLLYKSQGVSNVPGTGLLPQFGGSLLKDANIITKAERTGEMGAYGGLGKPTSGESILSLAEQQTIGKAAAKTAGWEIDESRMNKYTPELIKGAGFDLKYKEAIPSEVTGGFVNPSEYKPIIGFEQAKAFTPGKEVTERNSGTTFGVVSASKISKGVDLTKVPGGDRSFVDKQMSELTGGRLGTGETLGNFTMQKIGVLPLDRRGTAMAGVYRKAVLTYPFLKRKHTTTKKTPAIQHIKKPDPKIFDFKILNDNVMPKKVGSDLFKFKIGAPDVLVKSMSARNLSTGLKIRNIAGNIKLDNVGIKLPKNKSTVANNINKIMGEAAKPIKIKMRK